MEKENKKYTCPMHSHVQQDEPGNCPECGMKLEEMKEEAKEEKKGCC